MELEVTTEKQPLLSRTCMQGKVTYSGPVPSREDLQKQIASLAKSKAEQVVVDRIQPKYGRERSHFTAYIYDSKDVITKIEEKHTVKRNFEKKEEKKEAPAEEKKKESPEKEAPKEETPSEEKKEEEAVEEKATKEEAPTKEKEEPAEKKEEGKE